MFTKAGPTPVTIGNIVPAEPKFSKDTNAFDVCICVTGDDGAQDWARLEFSNDYGKGNFADRTQREISMETLHKLGWEGEDLTELFADEHQLRGKRATVQVDESKPNDAGKTFFNVKYFITGGREPERISRESVAAKLAALTGGARSAGQPPSRPSADPFAGTEAKAAPQAQAAKPAAAPAGTGTARKTPF